MFIENLQRGFYDKIIGKRILIIVNYDIDAICASKILQEVFKSDNILYSLVPVMGQLGMQRAYNENHGDVSYVLLINCGGCVDIVELLQPNQDVIFFIFDSHRPYDVCNIYSVEQVCILGNPSSEENIPAFETIFRGSDSDDDDDENIENSDDEESDGERNNRFEKHEQLVLKKRQRRLWEEERDRVMFEYTQYSFYGRSTALNMFELAWKLSKYTMDSLWWAIVGVTEQFVLGKIERTTYSLEIEYIQSQIGRFTEKRLPNCAPALSASKINFENDLNLVLYRHWSVVESIRFSMYSACKLKLWTLRGEKKLQELLVEMGLPLMHAKQTFGSMDLELRQEFFSMVEKFSEKYDIPDIVYSSFTLSYGYRNRYSASDYVYAMLSILESTKNNKCPEDCFMETLDSLSRQNKEILTAGIDNSKILFSTIFKQVQSSLESQQVHSTGSFFYYILNEESTFFSYPYGLTLLSKFILNGYVAMSRSRRAPQLPLIASCPVDVERGLCLLIGIPPVRQDSPKNFFGKAFEQAANKSNAAVLQDFFDTSIIQIRQVDLTRFLDALTILLM